MNLPKQFLPFFRESNADISLNTVVGDGGVMANRSEEKDYIKPLPPEIHSLREGRKKRVLDAISMNKEPDRVPVISNGLNFFPAHYAGISCEEYMHSYKSMLMATKKFIDDFPFDMHFTNNMLCIGNMVKLAQFDLLHLPGQKLPPNVGYQFNEVERLRSNEYDEFLEHGIDFLADTLAPRIAPGIFRRKGLDHIKIITLIVLEFMKYGKLLLDVTKYMRKKGQWTQFGSSAYPPYDILCFAFRTLPSISRDLLNNKKQEQIIEICERMTPWLISLAKKLGKISGDPGVWFTAERAFSLSPRQFERFYWPTFKEMIIKFVKSGLIPYLTIEGDATHLVPFLLELPKNIARRCVFNCDNSDIFEVNRILDGHMCILGNVPLSTLCVGSPKDVEKYCEKLFEKLKPGGGYMLSGALGIPDEAQPKNLLTMINYAQKYGNY
ncbi:MAG: hypothetical protein GY870_16830 [archaeon]|nr:hypothetical protein [archaeon]